MKPQLPESRIQRKGYSIIWKHYTLAQRILACLKTSTEVETSSSVVAHEQTLIRMTFFPCQTEVPHQQTTRFLNKLKARDPLMHHL